MIEAIIDSTNVPRKPGDMKAPAILYALQIKGAYQILLGFFLTM